MGVQYSPIELIIFIDYLDFERFHKISLFINYLDFMKVFGFCAGHRPIGPLHTENADCMDNIL